MRRSIVVAVIVIIGVVGVWRLSQANRVRQLWYDLTAPSLPAAESAVNAMVNRVTAPLVNLNVNRNVDLPDGQVAPPPAEKNLAVPFAVQAPNAKWDREHEEFCEEASILMVGRYFQGRTINGASDTETALQALKRWELDQLGFFESTTAEETALVIAGVYGLAAEVLSNPTIDQIKAAVAAGQPVIIPAAGRQLGNPNFRRPGPIYHMLVVKGYTRRGQLITNDPGTRRGADYVYDAAVVMEAMHDWNGGDVDHGAKVAIVVKPASR